jgi:hypothetical protein
VQKNSQGYKQHVQSQVNVNQGVESFVDVEIDNLNAKLFTASKWWKLYQELVAFMFKFGHTLVPQAYVVNGLNLGS